MVQLHASSFQIVVVVGLGPRLRMMAGEHFVALARKANNQSRVNDS